MLADIATRHQVHIERLKANEVKTFKAYSKAMINNTLFELNNDGELTDLNRRGMNNKIKVIKSILAKEFTDFKEVFDESLIEFAEYEAEFQIKSLEQVVKHEFSIPTPEQIKTAIYTSPFEIKGADGGSLVNRLYKDWSARQITITGNMIHLGYSNGLSNAQIGKQLRNIGIENINRNMEKLIRTTVQHAAGQTRNKTFEKNRDVIGSVRWVSTLDNRTSSICRGLDGKEWKLDDPKRLTPPVHIGCRSTVIAVLNEDMQFLDKGRTRKSRGAGGVVDVPEKQTYYSWLKTQPDSFIDSAIGRDRRKLLLNGGLSVKRFAKLQLQTDFQPMTLKKMKKYEPTAFKKADILQPKDE